MNEPIGSPAGGVLAIRRNRIGSGQEISCWIGSMRGSMRVNAWR